MSVAVIGDDEPIPFDDRPRPAQRRRRSAVRDRVLDAAGKPLAAGHGMVSGTVGGLFGGAVEKAVGVNPYEEVLGAASKAYNEIQRYALTHDQDDQPQMHQELRDGR